MKNALSINKYINKFLTESEAVTSLVSVSNIRPLILAPTIFPYVSFMHGNISSSYTKDGWSEDTTEVTIIAVSDDYSQTVDIAEAVRDLLDNKTYRDDDIFVSLCYCDEFNDWYVAQDMPGDWCRFKQPRYWIEQPIKL